MHYLVIHFLENPQDFEFDNLLDESIRAHAGSEDILLTADNFSDAFTIQQYQKAVENSAEMTVICSFANERVSLGVGLTLLNALIRKPNVKLLTNLLHPKLKPFMVRLGGGDYSDVNEMVKKLFR